VTPARQPSWAVLVHGMRLGDLAALGLHSFHAVQAQRRSPPSHSAGPPPCHELAGVGGRAAAAWRPDALAGRGGAGWLGSAEAQQSWRAATVFRLGDQTRADAAAGVPPGPAPGRGVQPPRPGVRRTPTACPGQCWPCPPRAGQHGPRAVRARRVERREAWPGAPSLAQASLGRGRRHRRDRSARADRGFMPTMRPKCRACLGKLRA